jgi:dethiobiotin synthetase
LRGLFVTGTDTEAGKTVVSACLLAAMRSAGENVRASKPVLTGTAEPAGDGWPADDTLLARAAGMEADEVAGLRFGPAVSPHLAAELEQRPIDPDRLLARVRATLSGAETVVVEGVGGLLVPIAGAWTVRDMAAELALPLLVAARPGLGTISHTLLTLEAARASGLEVRAVVLTPWPQQPGQIELSNRETIALLGGVPVATLPFVAVPEPAEMARAGATLPWHEWLEGAPTAA